MKKLFLCYLFGFHDWTCKAQEGIAPSPEQIKDGISGFWDYAKMYCKRCGKMSDISEKALRCPLCKEKLHKAFCCEKNCPWNGHTIFPKEKEK